MSHVPTSLSSHASMSSVVNRYSKAAVRDATYSSYFKYFLVYYRLRIIYLLTHHSISLLLGLLHEETFLSRDHLMFWNQLESTHFHGATPSFHYMNSFTIVEMAGSLCLLKPALALI